jgi:hypothetical protein
MGALGIEGSWRWKTRRIWGRRSELTVLAKGAAAEIFRAVYESSERFGYSKVKGLNFISPG